VGSGGSAASIFGGTSEIMKTIIARDITGLRA
jgi:alkylation response protein AidB-like acyl-CoA dehydrogenase